MILSSERSREGRSQPLGMCLEVFPLTVQLGDQLKDLFHRKTELLNLLPLLGPRCGSCLRMYSLLVILLWDLRIFLATRAR